MKTTKFYIQVFFLLVILCGCQPIERFTLQRPSEFMIWVDGAIKHPRKLSIEPYSTIEDVLSKLTLLENSDLSSLNLNTILHHNDKLTIPFKVEQACININSATQEQLSMLNQIGPVIAARIIEYRNNHGLFQRIDDIILVKGIGKKTLEKNVHLLCL